jgi:rhodanese-related sulfurtransferase
MKKVLIVLLLFVLVGCSSNKNGVINYMKAKELMINNQAILVDVREEDEYNEHHIAGASLLPLGEIDEDSAKEVIGDTDKYVIVYCKSGKRSSEAYNKLKDLGYENVYNLGSIDNWKE